MTDEEFARLFPNIKWPQTFEGKDGTYIKPTQLPKLPAGFSDPPITEDTIAPSGIGSFRSRPTTPREILMDNLYRIYGDDLPGRHRVDNLMVYPDFFASPLFGAYDTPQALNEGRYKDAILSGITAAAPFLGKPVKLLKEAARRRFATDEIIGDLINAEPAHNLGKTNVQEPLVVSRTSIAPDFDENIKSGESPIPGGRSTPSIVPSGPLRKHPRDFADDPRITKNTVQSSVTPGKRNAYKFNETRFGEQNTGLRTIEAAEEPLSLPMKGNAIDWDNIVFREATPGAFWARSTPWIVPHNPLSKTARDFTLDYSNRAVTDKAGNLLKDIDGNDLVAKHIAGRRKKGEKDQGLTPDVFRSIIEDDFKIPILRVPKSELPERAIGQVSVRFGSPPKWIKVWDRLPKDQSDIVVAHEFAHIIDSLTGLRLTRGYTKELDKLYSENMTGQLHPKRLVTPKSLGYRSDEYRRERMAEAIRTASVNPNTIKTIAPKTATFLREIINKHPIVSKIIQVNGLPLGIATGAATAAIMGQNNSSRAQVPPEKHDEPYASISAGAQNSANDLRKIASALLATGYMPMRPVPDALVSIARVLSSARGVPAQANQK